MSILNPSKIMIVEDESIICQEVEDSLENLGYEVVAKTDNGADAIGLAELHNPDIILMDIRINGKMDGIQATAEIRKIEDQKKDSDNLVKSHIPIIALTAHAMKGDRERLIASGMDDYLAKPINKESLISVIEKYMKRKEFSSDYINSYNKGVETK